MVIIISSVLMINLALKRVATSSDVIFVLSEDCNVLIESEQVSIKVRSAYTT